MSLSQGVRKEIVRFSKIFGILFVVAVFAVLFALTLLPETVPKEEAIVILQTIIGLDGTLIGFSGIVGGLILTRPNFELDSWLVVVYILITTVMFLLSVFYCIGALAVLSDKSPLMRLSLIQSLFSLSVGIGVLFQLVYIGIAASSRRMRDAE